MSKTESVEELANRLQYTTLNAELKLDECAQACDWTRSPDYPIREHLRRVNNDAWRHLLVDRKLSESSIRSLIGAVEWLYVDTLTFYEESEPHKDWHEWMADSETYTFILESWQWSHSGESRETSCLPDLAAKCGDILLVWADVYAVFVPRLVTEAVGYLNVPDYFKGAAIALNAAETAKFQMAIAGGDDAWTASRSALGARAAQGKYQRDPKQEEKRNIKARWADWQADPALFSGKTAFAKKMLDECERLTSEKHITDLCRKWEKL